MADSIAWTFGELESVLASVHDIDQTKRTAFQSRLKNFHRLGYPLGFKAVKGKAATYTPLQIIEMALAVEMTQLGLPPERLIHVLCSDRWPVLMAIQMVARELGSDPALWSVEAGLSDRALSMFLYFDPSALHPLTLHMPAEILPDLDEAANSFFYGGIGIVREGLAAWTSGRSARLSLINLTALAGNVVASPFETGTEADLEYRRSFFHLLEQGARAQIDEWPGSDEGESDYVWNLIERENVTNPAALADRASITLDQAAEYLREFSKQQEGPEP